MNQIESQVLHRLQEWEQKEGTLPRLLQFYRELLLIQSEAKSRIIVKKPGFVDGLVRDRLVEGIPLLLFEDFLPDWRQVQLVFEQVAAWAGKDPGAPSEEGRRLRTTSSDINLLTMLSEIWYQGHSLEDLAWVESVNCELLGSVIAAALKPFLSAYAELLSQEVDQELWRRRYCPICGGRPDFAYLDKDRGARWLLCSRCDAEWLFQRIECPYCGTQKKEALAYFAEEKPSLYRLYVCEECHTYIKSIDLRRTGSEILLPLERMMTFGIDRQALEAGYKPGVHRYSGLHDHVY